MNSRAGLENYSLAFLRSTATAVLLLLLCLSTVSSVIPLARAAPTPALASLPSSPTSPAARSSCIDATHDLHGHIDTAQAQFVLPGTARACEPAAHTSSGPLQAYQAPMQVQRTSHQHTVAGAPAPLKERTSLETGEEVVFLVRRKSIAAKIRDAFHKLGHKIKHAFQKVGHAIKTGFQKFGHAIKTAAKKVGHFIKTTGAKIAKVALKIGATIGKVVAKVVGFIPGAKGIGKAIEGGSEGLNKASDAIHVKIGGKLGKAMKNMDKAQKYVGYIP